MQPARLVLIALSLLTLGHGAASAQVSPSYKIEEHAFNAGGHPADGVGPASSGLRLTLGALGDGVQAVVVSSASFRIQGGFVSASPPPGEVQQLLLAADKQTLSWSGEVSSGTYNIYRDGLSVLPGLGYGACLLQGITGTSTVEATLPAPGAGFFYLVTVDNRLGEEGTKGFDSEAARRAGSQCP